MNGSPASLAVNLAPDSDRLLLYLQEGGACWGELTCLGVANPDGFGQEDFDDFAGWTGKRGIFSRADAANPFRDWNHVFVPYCSGDVHGGANPAGPGGRMHLGARNMDQFLERILVTFPHVKQVVLAGSSAGGVGAAMNFDRVQTAFGAVPVTLLNDSGPVTTDSYLRPCLQQKWRDAWLLDDALPADCEGCRAGPGGLVNLLTFLAGKYPERRIGLVLSSRDGVFRDFFGFGAGETCDGFEPMPAPVFEAAMMQLRDEVLVPHPNVRIFMVPSEKHVYLRDAPVGKTVVDGVSLSTWMDQLVSGDPGWGHVGP
jgi:hypothetical protein